MLLRMLIFALMATALGSLREECPNVKSPLSSVRKRRHLAFPDGSTVSMTASVVKTFMTHMPSGWYLVIEAEIVYPLPNAKMIAATKRRKLHHRQKREFWEVLESAFDQRNMDGRACVIRTICEAKKGLAPPGKSLVHDILRVMFKAPLQEEEFVDEIRSTYNELLDENYCKMGKSCQFSCLNFILDFNRPR